jgi:protocatechuate 3,4-dioxygenase beta subunit
LALRRPVDRKAAGPKLAASSSRRPPLAQNRPGGDWTLMSGRVLDPSGNPVAGARIDIWQADKDGQMKPGDLRALLTHRR